MSDHRAKNIISMSQFAGKLDIKASQLIRRVQQTSADALDKLLRGMLDKADDALFDLANKADSNAAQQLYFDAMRDIRLKRSVVERGFSENIGKLFEQFVNGDLQTRQRDSVGDLGEEAGMELVEVEDMEESIAIRNMAAKAERECYYDLYDLTVRLEEVTRRRGLKEGDHPLNPTAIADVFGDTVMPLEMDIQVKLIVYKLFDKYVMSGICAIHKDVNSLLIREGILPKIRRAVRKGRGGTARRSPVTGQDYSPSGDSDADGVDVGGQMAGIFAPAGFGGVPLQGGNLIGSLSAIQGYMVDHGYTENMTPEQIGAQILDVSRRVGAIGPGRGAADEKTINMVSLIFDYILEDESVPDAVKVLLARLQIPMLKLALLDQDFFNRKKHPARQLLNEMARASIGWQDDSARDGDALVAAITSVVDRVLSEFEDDPNIFQVLVDEFRDFLEVENERAQLFEERTKKTTEGKERVEFAKQRTEAWIDMWASRANMPDFIAEFLRTTWKNTLLITMHRYGEDSQEWASHIKTVNNLLWSITPKKTAQGGRLLVKMIPGIIEDVRKGMELASAHPETIETFFEELANLHAETVNGGVHRDIVYPQRLRATLIDAPAGLPAVSEAKGPMYVPTLFDVHTAGQDGAADTYAEACASSGEVDELIESVREEVNHMEQGLRGDNEAEEIELLRSDVEQLFSENVEEIVLHAPGAGDDSEADEFRDQFVSMAESLNCGEWVEFIVEAQEPIRAKLAWKSPLTSCCLFVNRKGLKVAEKTVCGLATELRAGRARVLAQAPLLDRAINALTNRGGAGDADELLPA